MCLCMLKIEMTSLLKLPLNGEFFYVAAVFENDFMYCAICYYETLAERLQ